MTKRFGVFVGAVKQLAQPRPVDFGYENGTDHVLVRDVVTLAAAPIADIIQLGVFGWESIINPNGDVWFDALGASTTLSIGDAGHPAALAAATSTVAAGSMKISKSLTLDLYFAPLWQALGYATLAAAKAVADQCELIGTIAGGAATGKVAWQLTGQRRI